MKINKIIPLILIYMLFSCSTKSDKILEDLKSNESNIQIDAIESLRYEKGDEYKALIKIAFKNNNDEVVWRAVELAGIYKYSEFTKELIDFLGNKNPVIKYTARDAISNIGIICENDLLNTFSKSNDEKKILILHSLSKIGDLKTLSYNFKNNNDKVSRKIKKTLSIISQRIMRMNTRFFVKDVIFSEIFKKHFSKKTIKK
ncbi:MAG: HEAT repeat domain-containing protein [Desulfobacterales bacterium]|nr:HEAT repeat domain-containing protein [Desulfobacterales bacterium]